MSDLLKPNIFISEEAADIPSETVASSEDHILTASVDTENRDIYLRFSSRIAMYDFARSLLHEAIYEVGAQMELYPLAFEGKLLLVNGVRLSRGSSRIFISYT